MPTRKPQAPQSAQPTPDQMKAVLPRLRARITELQAAEVDRVEATDDAAMGALEQKINSTIADVYPPGTVQYYQCFTRLYQGPPEVFDSVPVPRIRQGFVEGIDRAIKMLQSVIELFEEQVGSGASATVHAKDVFRGLSLHPEIARACTSLFENGHYANAVEDACKALDGLVKLRSGRFDLSGTELMQAVFSPKAPVLRFNPLQTKSDESEQQGMMFLFSGAMLALRNPRAHGLLQDTAESALEFIGFLSLLANAVDRAQK
jgi:uncharacterized protein (TIGR02391 family)